MAGAIFSRIKTWISTEDVTAADINAEFDNILNNLLPAQLDDYSVNIAEMQTKTDPGEVGTESLPTTLAGEIERLRFAIGEVKGTGQWYSTASSSITELASVIGGGLDANRISSGKRSANSSQPLFLVPAGSAATVTLEGATTNFIYSIAGTQYTISSDVTATGLVAAPSTNNTALVNDDLYSDQDHTQMAGEYGSSLIMDTAGSEITSKIGEYAAFKINDGVTDEYFLAYVDSATKLSKINRGYFFNSSDNGVSRLPIANNDTITLLKLTWVFAKADGTLAVTYNNPRVSVDQPSSPAVGDYWFDMANSLWKTFNSTIWVDATATLIGVCAQDSSNCIAARGFDFFKDHNEINTLELVYEGAGEVRGKSFGSQLKVYGSSIKYLKGVPRWNMASDLDSGVSESANTVFYFYIKENGDTVISDVPPMDRTADLKGLYHPFETWRCVGQAHNDASQDLEAVISYHDSSNSNFALTNSVSGNALTVKLHANPASKFALKESTAGLGTIAYAQIAYSLDLTVTSGATLGHEDATDGWVYLYLLRNGSNIELGLSSNSFDNSSLLTSTAMDATADDQDFFSEVARTSVAVKLMARGRSNQTTAGTWAATLAEVVLAPFDLGTGKLVITSASSGSFTTSSATYVDVTNLSITFHAKPNKEYRIGVVSTSTGYLGTSRTSEGGTTTFRILKDSTTTVYESRINLSTGSAPAGSLQVPSSSVQCYDNPGDASVNYKLQVKVGDGSTTGAVNTCMLEIKELN